MHKTAGVGTVDSGADSGTHARTYCRADRETSRGGAASTRKFDAFYINTPHAAGTSTVETNEPVGRYRLQNAVTAVSCRGNFEA
ncbi:MAG: hypothetical protein WA708_07045 [Acidobacteriaceae bacterium]